MILMLLWPPTFLIDFTIPKHRTIANIAVLATCEWIAAFPAATPWPARTRARARALNILSNAFLRWCLPMSTPRLLLSSVSLTPHFQ